MATVNSTSTISATVTLTLEEVEARALREIVSYGADAFLKTFYQYLGTSNLKQHERGVVSLFKTIGMELPPHLARINEARKVFEK